jgi:hypothetical protein
MAQIVGSIFASGMLLVVFEYDILGGYNTIPVSMKSGEKNVGAAFFVELVTTMLLLYAVFATIDPRRNSATDLGPLAIGGAVMICHLIGVPVTGCGINPARSIGPAIFGAQVGRDDLWLFIVAPLCASIIVAFTYPYFFAEQAFAVGGLRARFTAKKNKHNLYPMHTDVETPRVSRTSRQTPRQSHAHAEKTLADADKAQMAA